MVCNHCVKPFVFSPFSNRLHKNWTSEPFAVHLRHVCYFSFFFANLTRIDWHVCVYTPWNFAKKTVCISKQAGQLSWSLPRKRRRANGLMVIHFRIVFGFPTLCKIHLLIVYVRNLIEPEKKTLTIEETHWDIWCEHVTHDKQEFMHTSGLDVAKELLQKHN